MENTKSTIERNQAVLRAAYNAWMAAAPLRACRLRNKRYAYGDQWADVVRDAHGRWVTERAFYTRNGREPITNNLIRQLVKTIVGRFRAQVIDERPARLPDKLKSIHEVNRLDELDSRALEEFVISGCCVQRVHTMPGETAVVENVSLSHFFVNAMTDVRGRDCELVGQLHDMSLAQLLQRLQCTSRRQAAWVRRLYSDHSDERTAQTATALGADVHSGTDFWYSRTGKCRAIEVWTLDSREQMSRGTWSVTMVWHCRWFTPMGDLLAEYDSPWLHRSHPFVVKMYPLIDGEVHALVEDVIDQQRLVNRLVTMVDQVIRSNAKGVLLFPETALPEGFTWEDVRRLWSSTGGLLPYDPSRSDARPEQIIAAGADAGAYDMINLQLKLMEQASGVSGALQGKSDTAHNSASLYQMQADNANMALTDVYDTFADFCRQRDALLQRL
ncbi:MAG: hypothetical protein IJ632_00250 [Muribaculaceae bacterium]|nr:hypothetical protein [Muribaculaceae bacterium]